MKNPEEIFLLDGENVHSMPERPMRQGMFGKTLEDALQTLLEQHPEIIPGKQITTVPKMLQDSSFCVVRCQ